MPKKLKLDKTKTIVFTTVGIIIIFFIYLSIPSLYKFDKFKLEIENKIYNQFGLNLKIDNDINYVFFPSPRIKLNNA